MLRSQYKSDTVIISKSVGVSHDQLIIYYNRVPKCGSSLLNNLLRRTSFREHTFEYLPSTIYDVWQLSSSDQDLLSQSIIAQVEKTHHSVILFERHIYFFDIGFKTNLSVHYINQLRDPIARAVSLFGYRLYLCHEEKKCPNQTQSLMNKTIDQCLRTNNTAFCDLGNPDLTPLIFLCGQSPDCLDWKSSSALDRILSIAKKNIEKYYTFIGVLEYIENSFELFEYTYPTIFKGINKAYRKISKQKRVNMTPEKFRQTVSNASIEKLRQLLKHEFDLYYFVVQRFTRSYYQAFNKMPVSAHH